MILETCSAGLASRECYTHFLNKKVIFCSIPQPGAISHHSNNAQQTEVRRRHGVHTANKDWSCCIQLIQSFTLLHISQPCTTKHIQEFIMENNRGNKLPRSPDLGLLRRQEIFPFPRAWHVETASCTPPLERTAAAPFQKDKSRKLHIQPDLGEALTSIQAMTFKVKFGKKCSSHRQVEPSKLSCVSACRS